MSLVYDNRKDEPQTHVLIIGVGAYHFLDGGKSPKAQLFFSAQSLGQLSSPPVSAIAFYEMVMELGPSKKPTQPGQWSKPLGSVEVLLSPLQEPAPQLNGVPVEAATRNNIRDAYKRWKKECDMHEDNIAIFYFCGHGLDKGEHYLLAQDFGEDENNPWEGSFAFDLTRRAFFSCKAQTQLFFVDACRQLTSDMLTVEVPANPIEPPSLRARDCRFNLTQKAAAANESAYGRQHDVSFYTKALINAMRGNASDNDDGTWRISTGTLAARMNAFLQMESAAEGYPQRCISTTSDVTDIIHFEKPPFVALTINCNPEAALEKARLSCQNLDTSKEESREPKPEPWKLNVEAGIYSLRANFADDDFTPAAVLKNIAPPLFNQQFNCAK